MPIYEYSCKKCDAVFEYLMLSNKDADPPCPKCGQKKVVKLMSTGNVRPRGIPSGSGGFAPPKCAPAGGR